MNIVNFFNGIFTFRKNVKLNGINVEYCTVLCTGVGLMEIVTEPDFRSAEEATSFVKELQLILLAVDSCDCKMEGALCSNACKSARALFV